MIRNKIFWFLRPTKNELTELYSTATLRIQKKLDIVSILNDLTYLKLITKFFLKPSIETNFAIRHSSKNILDLDQIYMSDTD